MTIFKGFNLHTLFVLRHDFYKSYNLSRENIDITNSCDEMYVRFGSKQESAKNTVSAKIN